MIHVNALMHEEHQAADVSLQNVTAEGMVW